ncbi:MAG: hypothetical protein FJ399_03990 [Verrucomicrobia bacterium]|nr:hypothetical protein [Verrucomicrobiota bacterium]
MEISAATPLASLARTSATQLRGESLRAAPPEQQRAAVAAQFEAILVRQLLNPTLTKLLGTGEGIAASIYGDLLSDTVATQLSAGRGLGLKELIERQLTPRGEARAGAPAEAAAATTEDAP